MKTITLTRGLKALVDDEDYEELNQYKWHARPQGKNKKMYAARMINTPDGQRAEFMHRRLMGVKFKEKQMIDHIDGDPLNNQKNNLRKCTVAENNRNRKSAKGSSSKYLGVCKRKPYVAHIRIDGKLKSLGAFHSEEEAARAYDKAAKKYFGEFANLNFK